MRTINTYHIILNHLDLLRDIFKLVYNKYYCWDYKAKLFWGMLKQPYPGADIIKFYLPPSDLKQELMMRWHIAILSRIPKRHKLPIRRHLLNTSIAYVTSQVNLISKQNQTFCSYSVNQDNYVTMDSTVRSLDRVVSVKGKVTSWEPTLDISIPTKKELLTMSWKGTTKEGNLKLWDRINRQ